MDQNVTFQLAAEEDLPQILQLYRSVIGREGCTWDLFYPNKTTLQDDFNAKQLYVLRQDRSLIGAGSVAPENELDDLEYWVAQDRAKEPARIVISPAYQGKGYGKHLVQQLCFRLKSDNCSAAHILVAQKNLQALRMYEALGFRKRGSCHRYELDFFAYEKLL